MPAQLATYSQPACYDYSGPFALFRYHKNKEAIKVKSLGVADNVSGGEERRERSGLPCEWVSEEPIAAKQQMEKARTTAAEGDDEEYKPVQTEFGNPPIRPKDLFVASTSGLLLFKLAVNKETSSSVALAAW
ncbi:hypothetical protein V5O48_010489 [Marasmius crinis-equi]|uniref:Uncharacterized protein n=1 Tax=Marasmius crinis-equi TaxID=585013 RepID=A0ABR3F8D2_9AGAR